MLWKIVSFQKFGLIILESQQKVKDISKIDLICI